MTPIRIDFAPNSLRRMLAKTRPATWLFGCIGLALCLAAAILSFDLRQQQRELGAGLDRVLAQQMEFTARMPVTKKSRIPDLQATAINAAILQLNLPWRDVFDAIEEATPPSIALLTLEPDPKKKVVKVVAEAKSSDDMIDYIRRLKKQEFFNAVVLTKHETNEQDPNKPLRFQFDAQWAGVEE
jgi:Tfp pilus assembly protein PilN